MQALCGTPGVRLPAPRCSTGSARFGAARARVVCASGQSEQIDYSLPSSVDQQIFQVNVLNLIEVYSSVRVYSSASSVFYKNRPETQCSTSSRGLLSNNALHRNKLENVLCA